MPQFCLFGGYEGYLQPEKKVYFTAFGGSDLIRPTLARRILWARQQSQRGPEARQRFFVITLFGATDIKSPTLAEEFIDLKAMADSGTLSLQDWEHTLSELHRFEQESISSLTLFGALGETALPGEKEEIDSLALQRHLGNIPDSAGEVLQFGVGQAGPQREAIIQKAVAAAM